MDVWAGVGGTVLPVAAAMQSVAALTSSVQQGWEAPPFLSRVSQIMHKNNTPRGAPSMSAVVSCLLGKNLVLCPPWG